MIIAVCPNDKGHDQFLTTAHVVEEWRVDKYGNFIEAESSLDTAHGPDRGNVWRCSICGAEAIHMDESAIPKLVRTIGDLLDHNEILRDVRHRNLMESDVAKGRWLTAVQTVAPIGSHVKVNAPTSDYKSIRDMTGQVGAVVGYNDFLTDSNEYPNIRVQFPNDTIGTYYDDELTLVTQEN